jgi:hypothetical protein
MIRTPTLTAWPKVDAPDSPSLGLRPILQGMSDLTDDDKAIVAKLLRDTVAADRFPLSPRVRRWKAIHGRARKSRGPSGNSVPKSG